MNLINVDQRRRQRLYLAQAQLVTTGFWTATLLLVVILAFSAFTYAEAAPSHTQSISSLSLVDQWGEE